jgi:hypothetical protein
MNKILITSEELQALLTCADINIRTLAGEIAKRYCEQPRFSIVEWHPPIAESIEKGRDILIRFDNGTVAPALSDDFDYAIERGAIEWACLPE